MKKQRVFSVFVLMFVVCLSLTGMAYAADGVTCNNETGYCTEEITYPLGGVSGTFPWITSKSAYNRDIYWTIEGDDYDCEPEMAYVKYGYNSSNVYLDCGAFNTDGGCSIPNGDGKSNQIIYISLKQNDNCNGRIIFTLEHECYIPEAPKNLTYSTSANNIITLKWDSAKYATTYDLYKDDDIVYKKGTSTSYMDPAPLPAGYHSYYVTGFSYDCDPNGIEGYDSAELKIVVIRAPIAKTEQVDTYNITENSAALEAVINPQAAATTYYFEYGTTTSYGSKTPSVVMTVDIEDKNVDYHLTGLTPDTTYHFRVVASNSKGTTYGNDQTFTTEPAQQVESGSLTVTILPAEAITAGAMWQVDSGTLQNSGATVPNLSVGSHTVNFKEVAGWTKPASKNVTIQNGQTATSTGTYTQTSTGTKPTTTTEAASSISSSSATLNGTVNPNGAATTYYFEYGITTSYGSTTAIQNAGLGTTSTAVTANITGLTAATAYHFRVIATNSAGTTYGSDNTFSSNSNTLSCDDFSNMTLLVFSFLQGGRLEAVGGKVDYIKIELDGGAPDYTFYSDGTTDVRHFGYSCKGNWKIDEVVVEGAEGPVTTLIVRECNFYGSDYWIMWPKNGVFDTSLYVSFLSCDSYDGPCSSTGGLSYDIVSMCMQVSDGEPNITKPTAATETASSISSNSATLNGTVNPNGAATTYYFEYGTTTSYGSTTTSQNAGSGTTSTAVTANITGLNAETTYHFRFVATNSAGTTSGVDQTFTTTPPAIKPTVTTDSASSIAEVEATLSGTLNPNGIATSYYFEYGLTTSYGSITPAADGGSGTTIKTVTANISGLIAGTTYHFRLVATNSAGTAYGSDKIFTTIQQVGSLTVTISPSASVNAGAQWQVDGGAWNNSDATVSNLTVGNHTVEFKDVTGWTKPASQTVTISNGQTATTTGTYIQQFGSLTVTISPSASVTAGAQWQVDGGAWNNSGATVSNLTVGNHTVEFKDVTGWTKPAGQTVTISNGQTTTATGTYIQQVGSLTVTISPSAAVNAGAQWQVDGGAWNNNDATVSNLTVGIHTVEFKDVTGWTKPAGQTVTISNGQTATATGTYTQQVGSLTVTISPENAVTAGAQWQIDSTGVWNSSGATVSNLTVGTHTINFKDVSGWITPVSQTVTISNGQTASAAGTYIQQVGSLTVTISPANAVTAGAQWQVDGGAWNNSGATVSNLTVGIHTVSFKDITGWTKPASQTVTISNGQTATATGTYIQQFGSLTVTISPAAAVNAGAQWQVDGGAWNNSSATVSNLTVGTHTVGFKDVTNANLATPSNQTVTILNGQTATATGTYTQQVGSLTVTISPAAAVTAGAQWKVDNGAWNNSGATVSNLTVGIHTVGFKDVTNANLATPSNQTVTILNGQTATATGTYTQSTTLQIIAGNDHTVALKEDGTVWAWGSNDDGQLGDGTSRYMNYRSTPTPVQVTGLTEVSQIATGWDKTIALKNDGTVWAWGSNDDGQLGDGTTIYRGTPVQVSGLTGVVQIAAGAFHTVALKSDGTVRAWGYNSSGQLGDGTTTFSSTPVQVTGLTGVAQVTAGEKHTLALKSDGTLWAWGYNSYGQLGDGTRTDSSTPVQVSGLTGVIQITAGEKHTLALKSDGTLWAWGENEYGQLGNGKTTDRSTPVQVSGLIGISQIAAGASHTLALKSDGTLWAWGRNYSGQLGDGTNTDSSTPVQVSGLIGISQIAAGWYHTLALKSDGTLWAWGHNYSGQLGDGTSWNDRTTPVQVTGLTGVTQVATGDNRIVALKEDGTLWAWGNNEYGELGDGTRWNNRPTPVQVISLTGVAQVAFGVALKSDGTVWTWGTVRIWGDSPPVQVTGLTGVVQVDAGESHTAALKSDGTVWAWGDNYYGQLGDGTRTDSSTPVQVTGLTGVAQVAAGGEQHTVALKSDGTVWAWGDNSYGQLGDGTNTDRRTPVQVIGLTGVSQIAAGEKRTLALKSDGTVWTWGWNSYGQLGDGTNTDRSTPVQVTGLTGVIQIAAGESHTAALKSDGTVWTWGWNSYGQLGDGTSGWEIYRRTPVQVIGLTGVSQIAAGYSNTVALKKDGTVRAWGSNSFGQLGDNSLNYTSTPFQSFYAGSTLSMPLAATANAETSADYTTLNGKVVPNGVSTTYYFEYGLTTSYGSVTASQNAGSGTNVVDISSDLTAILPDTLYHFRLAAENSYGISYGRDQFFMTLGSSITQSGSLTVTISPVNAVSAGGQWQVDSGAWNNSEATVSNLVVGNHTVSFKDVAGWTKPADQTITITNGQTATATGTYISSGTKPTATTGTATSTTATTATLNGTLNPNGLSTNCYFEYGLTTAYGKVTATQSKGSGTTSTAVTAAVTGLTANTTYHFRLVGTNSAGTTYSSDKTFTTTTAIVTKPTATTGVASLITDNSAKLSGTITPKGASTTYYFEYGTTTTYGKKTAIFDAGSGTAAVAVNADLVGFNAGTTYHFRLVATNSAGTAYGTDKTFTTTVPPTTVLKPTVTTEPATSITATSAKLNGTVNPNGDVTSYYFQYGLTTSYGSTTRSPRSGSDRASFAVNKSITGLTKNTVYHFRIVAVNSAGTTYGLDKTFTTLQ